MEYTKIARDGTVLVGTFKTSRPPSKLEDLLFSMYNINEIMNNNACLCQ